MEKSVTLPEKAKSHKESSGVTTMKSIRIQRVEPKFSENLGSTPVLFSLTQCSWVDDYCAGDSCAPISMMASPSPLPSTMRSRPSMSVSGANWKPAL